MFSFTITEICVLSIEINTFTVGERNVSSICMTGLSISFKPYFSCNSKSVFFIEFITFNHWQENSWTQHQKQATNTVK